MSTQRILENLLYTEKCLEQQSRYFTSVHDPEGSPYFQLYIQFLTAVGSIIKNQLVIFTCHILGDNYTKNACIFKYHDNKQLLSLLLTNIHLLVFKYNFKRCKNSQKDQCFLTDLRHMLASFVIESVFFRCPSKNVWHPFCPSSLTFAFWLVLQLPIWVSSFPVNAKQIFLE